jgi:hypothetical protein
MPSTDISDAATCTTCSFTQDFSNYWTANLYFKARNGTFKRVPQIANQGLNGGNGGITVYYTSPGANQVTAFKPVSIFYSAEALTKLRWGLTVHLRASECSLEIQHAALLVASERIFKAASDAILVLTSEATMIPLALILS